MVVTTLTTSVFAAEAGDKGDSAQTSTSGGKSDTSISLSDINELLSALTYAEYIEQYKDANSSPESFKADVHEYDEKDTTAGVTLYDDYKGKKAIEVDESGKVTFNINVPETGLYSLRIDYIPTESDSTTAIERTLQVNGKVPFSEARSISMPKRWLTKYTEQEDGSLRFETDQNGNEIRPDRYVDYSWQTYTFTDFNGYYGEPLKIYLEEGENKISLECVRHGAVFSELEFFAYEAPVSYADVLKEYESKGYGTSDKEIYIDAELPTAVSKNSLYPVSDTVSPATEPQSASQTIRNTISTSIVGEWLEYDFYVEESAVYTLMFRYRQNASSSPISRRITIDGEVPFDAAESVTFGFSENWQVGRATADGQELKFYLEKGVHTLRLEANLGDVGSYLRRASAVQNALNEDYLEIIRLTGADPDEYRDYGFKRVMPHIIEDLYNQSQEIYAIINFLETEGELSASTATLTQIANRVYAMGTDEDMIAKNLDGLKNDLSSLSTWVDGMLAQALELDYIKVVSPEAELPKAEGSFFGGIWYEIQKFVYSFFIDYNSLAANDGVEATHEPIAVWTGAGRDQTQIIKDQIDSNFTPDTGIPVNIKLVAAGTLLPSILAGIGPDVALDGMTSTNTAVANATGSIIDFAVRGAVLSVNRFDDYEEIKARFPETAFEPITLYGNVYGLPTSLDWNMMFYRKDILGSLGIEVPETWDDMLSAVPVFQFNNMEIGIPHDISAYASFIFQNGSEFWADNGMRVNFDSNSSLEAFEYLCNIFTQYSLPYSFDPLNRFKTGEMPLFISSYMMYNTLTVFATNLSGLWGFTAMPGTLQDDGKTVDKTVVGSVDAVAMMKDCDNEADAWSFMKWYTDKDFQVAYSNEIVALLGESGMRSVANLDAIEELQWKKDDRDALIAQIEYVKCLPQYPGSYFIGRYVTFAMNNAYTSGADPVESMLGYVSAINKEISRKREEFGFETLAVGQTLADKRLDQATEALGAIEGSDRSANIDVIERAEIAIESRNASAIKSAAEALSAANAELFNAIAGYLTDAAAALATYTN